MIPTYDKCFFFNKGSIDGDKLNLKGKEKVGRWFTSGMYRNTILEESERGNWRKYLKIGVKYKSCSSPPFACGWFGPFRFEPKQCAC